MKASVSTEPEAKQECPAARRRLHDRSARGRSPTAVTPIHGMSGYAVKTTCAGVFSTKPGWWRMLQSGLADRTPIEEVVPGDHDDADRGDHRRRKSTSAGERDHGPAQRPQHEQHRHAVVEVELVGEAAEHDELQDDQPEPACEAETAARSPGDRLRRERYAPVPVSRKKTGAQMFVIQRVMKSAADAVERSVGFCPACRSNRGCGRAP